MKDSASSMARELSLKPAPLKIHTTVSFLSIHPCAIRLSRAVTGTAETGSTHRPSSSGNAPGRNEGRIAFPEVRNLLIDGHQGPVAVDPVPGSKVYKGTDGFVAILRPEDSFAVCTPAECSCRRLGQALGAAKGFHSWESLSCRRQMTVP